MGRRGHGGMAAVASAALALAVAMSLAGCGGPASNRPPQRASAHLSAVPVGSADIEYDPATRVLTVTAHITGVAPATTLTGLIRRGGCSAAGGDPLETLSPGIADAHGDLDTSTRVGGVDAVPTAAALEFDLPPAVPGQPPRAVLCAELAGQTGMLRMVRVGGAGDGPTGTALLDLDPASRRLTVRLRLRGLEPGSWHRAHIHVGSCDAEGPVALPLPALRADRSGRAVESATLDNVSGIGPWYVNVHRGPGVGGGDAAPVSCGDLSGS